MPASPELRQLPIGGALEAGWRLFLKSLPAIFLPVWFAGVINAVPALFAGGGALGASINRTTIVITVICWLVESALYGAAIQRLDDCVTGTIRSHAQALRIGMRAAVAILIGDLLYNIATWIGFFLLIVPGVILGTTWAFFAYAAVLDRKNLLEMFGYSHALAWPQWWRSSAVLSAPAIVLLIYDVIASWPDIMSAVQQLGSGNLLAASVPPKPWYDLGLMPVIGACVWCYVLAVCYVQYRNLQAHAAVH